MRLAITPSARIDLRDIAEFSADNWGRSRARLYLAELRRAIAQLRRHALIGPSADDIVDGLRRLSVNQHLIFYRVDPDQVIVLRVLHASRDASQHLA